MCSLGECETFAHFSVCHKTLDLCCDLTNVGPRSVKVQAST